MLVWLAVHGRLLTNVARCKRGLSTDAMCPVCKKDLETIQHVLRDCPGTLELWKQIVPLQIWRKFSNLHFEHWVRWNPSSKGVNRHSEEWRHTFAMICWWLWRRRNSVVFEDKRISNQHIVSNVSASLGSMKEARKMFMQKHITGMVGNENREQWRSPPEGWVKLNTDGAFSHLYPRIASGGILRDELGNFLRAFVFKGEERDIVSAELWGCLHGLKMAWDMGFRKILLESDSVEAIDLIKSPLNEAHEDRNLIAELQSVISRDWIIEVDWISRLANNTADLLAKAGLSTMPGIQFVLQADLELEGVLVKEKG